MIELIKTDVGEIRYYVRQIKAKMHPGDYVDTLGSIIHFACREAERMARDMNSDLPLRIIRDAYLDTPLPEIDDPESNDLPSGDSRSQPH